MLNNYDLSEVCNNLDIPLNGVYMKNTIPKKLKEGFYIINLDSAPNSGTHWLTLLLSDKTALYADPFAAPPPIEIIDAVKKSKLHLYFNNWVIQDIDSELCGYYSIALIHYVSTHKNLSIINAANAFINLFKDNTKLNGPILKKYLKPLNLPTKLRQHLMRSK